MAAMSDSHKKCDHCETKGADLRRCTGCYNVYYCSRDCQRLGWASHRTMCTKHAVQVVTVGTSNTAESSHGAVKQNSEQSQGSSSENRNNADERKTGVKEEYKTDESTEKASDNGVGGKTRKGRTGIWRTQSVGTCMTCRQIWQSLRCAKCNTVFYCSKTCQKKNWPVHKLYCKEVDDEVMPKKNSPLTDNERQIITNMNRRHQKDKQNNHVHAPPNAITFFELHYLKNFVGPSERCGAKLPSNMLTIHDRPADTLGKALQFARARFSSWNIIEDFDEIPEEVPHVSTVQLQKQKKTMRNVLVAFIFMHHDYVTRHGVYLKDSSDNITHVEFYFDHLSDDPRPYFTYADVSPGHYILIRNPLMHVFVDGQVGLRIDDPSEVVICHCDDLASMFK